MMSERGMGRGAALAPDVRVIEKKQETSREIKVAAYCRVSTDLEIQQQSLDVQIAAYNRVIREHPGWVLAGIYADKGISGTSVKHREEFLRMIEDAKAGKIQYILAKSISRFSRNTVDALAYVRELKSYGVSVFFEKEKLDTGNAISEFVLSIFAASAQEEIISLSNNMKVARRMRCAAGYAQWTHVYGYRCENREWIVEENEAEVIRRIFREYVSGKPITAICSELEADGIPSSGGKTAWRGKAVLDILHNEKYIGDVRMQKSFISDPIQHIRTDNRDAKLKQYYKENHHPAIIDRETYDMAQKMIAMRSTNQGFSQYPFYGVLKCPICGANMVRFATLRDTASYGWTCGGHFTERGNLREDRTVCPPYCFSEDLLMETYWESMRALDEFELRRLADKQDGKAAVARTILERRAAAGDTFPKIAYKDLCDLVERISFPKWSKLRIQWKCGLSTEVEMNISKATDHPYPRITREVVEHKTRKGDYEAETFVMNGKPMFKANPEQMVRSINRTQQEILNLLILEPNDFEPDVPHVYGTKCVNRETMERGKAE